MDLDLRRPIRWAVLYRAFATGALALGLVLVGLGVLAGFGTAVTTLVTDPLNPGPAIEQANPLVTIAFALVGLVVWQVGKTVALFLTLPRAAGRSAARQIDTAKLRSEVLKGLDERLAEMQTDVQETRRNVQELKRAEHAQQFDEHDHLADDRNRSTAGGSRTAESTGTGSSVATKSGPGTDAGSQRSTTERKSDETRSDSTDADERSRQSGDDPLS